METPKQRSLILKLIIIKKILLALVLLATSVISGFSWRNYDEVTLWADRYLVNGEFGLTRWVLRLVTSVDPNNLQWIARISGLYGVLLLVAVAGVWWYKTWGHLLFIGLVGSLIPVEVLELFHQVTPSKVILFILNLGIFGYLIWSFFISDTEAKSPEPALDS